MASKKTAVMNLSDREYVENFRGKEYRIPSRGEIILNRHEAVDLMGSYPGYNIEKSLKIRHIDSFVPDNSFMCNLCGESFKTIKDLEKHCEIKHEDKNEKAKRIYKCSVCNETVSSRQDLLEHLKKHKNLKTDEVLEILQKAG